MSDLTRKIFRVARRGVAAKLVQNEAIVEAMMGVFVTSTDVRQLIDRRLRRLVRDLDLITRADLAQLEAELAAQRAALAEARARIEALLAASGPTPSTPSGNRRTSSAR